MISHVCIVSRKEGSNSDNAFSREINLSILSLVEKYGRNLMIHNISLSGDGNTVLIHYSFPAD